MPLNAMLQNMLAAFSMLPQPNYESMTADMARMMMKAQPVPARIDAIFSVENTKLATPDHAVPVRIYRPSEAKNLPVIVFFHGGGWVVCDLDTHDSVCRTLCKNSGAVVVSVDYRLAPEHKFPVPLEDCYAATKYIADNAVSLGVDALQLTVAGDSAGGNLACAVALMAKAHSGPAIAHQFLIYPVTDYNFDTPSYQQLASGYMLTAQGMRWYWQQYTGDTATAQNPLASVLRADLAGLPPATIITAGYDPLRDEGKALADKMQAAGVAVSYKCFDDMLHGFVNLVGIVPASDEALGMIKAA
jgi:acetyl esterase